MRFRSLLRFLVLLPLLLAACGDLPEPFLGNPGATARRLAVPVTPMLAIPPPDDALLPPDARRDFADLLALSLQKEEVPALAREPRKTDWRLTVSATRNGDRVVPRYAVLDPSGHEQGNVDGGAIPAAGWTAGRSAVLGQAAKDGVQKVLALMMSIRATRDRADPNSLLNRVAKLYVPEVTGAPGDGNSALTRLVRLRLAELGALVQVVPDNADFTVKGGVSVTSSARQPPKQRSKGGSPSRRADAAKGPESNGADPGSAPPSGQQRIEIVWTVTRPSGVVSGKVSQLNSIRAGSLDHYWGDVATVVTQEAAGGIYRVVQRFIGREPDKPAAK